MIPRSHHLLCFGHDDLLLQTRKWILERDNNLMVITCSRAMDLHGILATVRIDLVILCHSVSASETEVMVAALRPYSPATGLLILTMNLDGPVAMLAQVRSFFKNP